MPSWFRKRSEVSAGPESGADAPSDLPPDAPPDVPLDAEGGMTMYVTGDVYKDTERVRSLIESLADLTSADDTEDLLVRMVDRAVASVGAERGLLFLSGSDEEGKPVLRVARSNKGTDLPRQASWSTNIVQGVLESREAVCLKVGEGESFDPSQSMVDQSIRAVMCVPLVGRSEFLGVMYVDNRASARTFEKSDLRFFEAYGEMLAVVWSNRNAVEERIVAARMKQDLELARDIQQNLVPEEPLRISGYTMVGRVLPADETGGDYFDFFLTRGNLVAMAIGDVSGHGMGAALVMSASRAYLRGFSEHESAPGVILRRVNRALARDTADDMFMSMFVCILNPDTREFTYANAGHTQPILLRAETGEAEDFHVTGVALGIEEEMEFLDRGPFTLDPGDIVVMFTDGLIEMRQGDEQYGRERVAESARKHGGGTAREMIEGIMDDAIQWAGGQGARDDDLTVAILKAKS